MLVEIIPFFKLCYSKIENKTLKEY